LLSLELPVGLALLALALGSSAGRAKPGIDHR
jgi:hypothetical protein